MAATTTRAGGRSRAADLRRADADLIALEHAEQLLRRARAVRGEDPRTAFELTHRAALRTAGVVIERANRERKRRLPLNAWAALERCGPMHRRWSAETAPMVAERDRLAAGPAALPDPLLLEEHLSVTAERITALRAELAVALLPAPQDPRW